MGVTLAESWGAGFEAAVLGDGGLEGIVIPRM